MGFRDRWISSARGPHPSPTSSEDAAIPSALIRIGLALIIWARFGSDLIVVRAWTWPELLLSVAFHASVAAYAVGYRTRCATASCFVVLVLMVHGWGIELGRHSWNYHHTRLLVIAVAASYFTPSGRALAVDCWRASFERPEPALPVSRIDGLLIMRVQVTVIYLSSVYVKLDPAFSSGDRLGHLYMLFYSGSAPLPPPVGWICAVLAWTVIAAEAFLAIGLWHPSLRRKALLVGLAMHAIFYLGLEVSTFSVTMALSYLAFVPPREVARVWERIAVPGHSTSVPNLHANSRAVESGPP